MFATGVVREGRFHVDQTMNPELRQFIEQTRFHRASVQRLAEMLPEDDAELDAWIAETVKDNAQAGLGAYPDAAMLKRLVAEIAV